MAPRGESFAVKRPLCIDETRGDKDNNSRCLNLMLGCFQRVCIKGGGCLGIELQMSVYSHNLCGTGGGDGGCGNRQG